MFGKYKKIKKIGQGVYGKVFKAINTETNELVAMKKINFNKEEIDETLVREITLLENLNHPNIVRHYETIV